MFWGYETATVMSGFGPRVRIKQEGAVNRPLGQHIKDVTRIAGVDRHVIHGCATYLAQQHRHTVDVRLAPDDPDTGVLGCLMDHMFATAKADFKPHRLAREQALQIQRIA